MAFERQIKILDRVEDVIDNSLEAGGEFFDSRRMPLRFKTGNQQTFGWPSHSPAYLRRRAVAPMLVQSGTMRDGIINKGKVSIIKGTIRITYEPTVDYAEYHRTGAGHNKVRDWSEKTDIDKLELNKVIQKYVSKNLPKGN